MRPSSDLPRRREAVAFGRRGRTLAAVVLLGALALALVARWVARLATDSWWFDSLGQRAVLATMVRTRLELGVIGGVGAAALLYACMLAVDRTPPLERDPAHDDHLVERYQVLVAEHGLRVRLGVAGAVGAVAGLIASTQWQAWLLFDHAVTFGTRDEVYQLDVGFYVFRLPFVSFVASWALGVLVVALLATMLAHYLSGTVRLAGPVRSVAGVRLHLSVLAVALVLVRAARYWIDRYELVGSMRGYVRGLASSDEHHLRPALELMVLVALATAVLVVVGLRQQSWRLPVTGLALWAVVGLSATSVFPAIVQRLVADRDPAVQERAAIHRNTVATRTALALDAHHLTTYAITGAAAATGPADLAAFADVRLLTDASALAAMAASRPTGANDGALVDADLGRYDTGAAAAPVYLSVPSLGPVSGGSWEVRHRTLIDAARPAVVEASTITSAGRPVIPALAGALGVQNAPLYIGEGASAYAVVTEQEAAAGAGSSGRLSTVPTSSFARRLAFALRFGDLEMVQRTSDADSVLYVRDVVDRVRTLAPFLAWDSDPYPVVADGSVVWVVDGYTTTDQYPSAERADVTGLARTSGLRRPFDYVRNSVKAVVDAHSGEVRLYVADDADPLLGAWRASFPSLFSSWSALAESVKTQLRYPADLLHVQSAMWGRYRTDTTRPANATEFALADGRWAAAPAQADRVAALSPGTTVAAGGTTTTTKARPVPTTSTPLAGVPGGVAGAAPPGVTYAMWGGSLVAVAAVVSAENPKAQQNLAALVVGTVDAEGRPGHINVLRADGGVPSPGAALQTLRAEILSRVPTLPDTALGDLQAVPVGAVATDGASGPHTVAWVLPWHRTDRPEESGVAVLVPGRGVGSGSSVESVLAAMFGVDPGFVTVAPGPAPDPAAPSRSTADELLAQAEAEYREALGRQASDPTAAIDTLKKAYESAVAAARKAGATSPVSTTAPVTTAPSPAPPTTAAITTTSAKGTST